MVRHRAWHLDSFIVLTALLELKKPLAHVPMGTFVDERLLILFAIGLGVLLLVFSAIKRVVPYRKDEQQHEDDFFERVWDEISSAATHIACGLLAIAVLTTGPDSLYPWSSLLYLFLGVFAFKAKREPDPMLPGKPSTP